jgi:hypothetical protein
MSEKTKNYILGSKHIDADGKVHGKGSIIALTDKQAKKLVNKVTLVEGGIVDVEVTETVDNKAKKPAKAKNEVKHNDGL